MTIAAGSQTQLAYVVETTYGQTPVTPSTQLVEYTSFDGGLTPNTLEDPTIKSNRQKSYARRGNVSTEGTLECILAPTNYDAFIEAALLGTWTADVLKVGTTKRSFAIEQGFNDIGEFRVFNGSTISTMGVSVPVDGLVTASFGFQGANTTPFSTTSIDATPTAVAQTEKFFHESGIFTEGNVSVGFLSAIEFELDNNLTTNYALGVLGARDVSAGTVSVTGTVTALFESVEFYNKFVQNVDSSIEFTLVGGANTMTFLFPRVKYTTGAVPVAGDGPLTVTMEFEALYDATEDTVLKITRT